MTIKRFNNSAVYQYFRYYPTKLLLTVLNHHYAGYIILLFDWKMSKSTKNCTYEVWWSQRRYTLNCRRLAEYRYKRCSQRGRSTVLNRRHCWPNCHTVEIRFRRLQHLVTLLKHNVLQFDHNTSLQHHIHTDRQCITDWLTTNQSKHICKAPLVAGESEAHEKES